MNNKNLAKLFIILSLFFGTILIFIVPSFQSPDEETHFMFAHELSSGQILPTVKDNKTGRYIPKEIISYVSEMRRLQFHMDEKYDYSSMYYDQLMSANYNSRKFNIKGSNRLILAYLAPAIGIQITDYLGSVNNGGSIGVSVAVQFARFFSLLIYSIIGYYSIKITPKFKKTFFVTLLMPLSLFLRSMVTYDSIILVLVALVLANILNLIYNDKCEFKLRHLILFIICGFILFNVKIVYSLVFFAAFAIPKENFGSKKDKIKKISIIIASVLILTFIRKIILSLYPSQGDSNVGKQLKYVMENPILYIKILLKNMFDQLRVQDYWMLGTFGYLDTYMPILFVFILKIYLIFTFILDSTTENAKFPIWVKVGYAVLIIFAISGIFTIMYLSWTPNITGKLYGNEITGVQGRYFIPFLLFIPIIFSNNILDKFKNEKIKQFILRINSIYENNFQYITILLLVVMNIMIFMRYYC